MKERTPSRKKKRRRYILQTSKLATLDFRERRYICAVLISFLLILLNLLVLLKKNKSAQSARLI